MKKTMMMAMAVMLTTGLAVANGPGGDKTVYTIDVAKSTVIWKGEKITGEHTGTLVLAGGTVVANGDMVASTDLILDMTSIVVTNIEDRTDNGKLVGHLKSEDFFSVAKNPTASFNATSFKAIQGARKDEANYTVTGELTIKGITNTISFPATIVVKDGLLTANAKATFDRTKWNIRYGSGSFFDGLGDNVIYDDVTFEFQLVAKANVN